MTGVLYVTIGLSIKLGGVLAGFSKEIGFTTLFAILTLFSFFFYLVLHTMDEKMKEPALYCVRSIKLRFFIPQKTRYVANRGFVFLPCIYHLLTAQNLNLSSDAV